MGRSLARWFEDAAMTVSDWTTREANALERKLADQLRDDLARFASTAADQAPFWKETCEQLAHNAQSGDPRFFKRWPLIVATMVYRTTPETIGMYRKLRSLPAWSNGLGAAAAGPSPGGGPIFVPNPRIDTAALHYATHLEHFRQVTGRSLLDHACILEFGGGYGGMCRFADRLGFAGRYIIFDLPPVLALQRYYLGLGGLSAEYAAEARQVLCHSLADVSRFVQPGTALLSTWALSEMPFELRTQIEDFISSQRSTAALFAYSKSWNGFDNLRYFEDLQARHADGWTWRRTPIDDDRYYLVGQRL
ncbi:MAG TPA: hypothetical protein VD970_09420 [Acetobacteraceae bacterium]|nr:hypothetical protein [Acetobacteraceae bacterium]